MIYFIGVESGGVIKIGNSTVVTKRLYDLQHANAEPLVLLGSVEGGPYEEALLHTHFAKDHIRGEWYKDSPRLLAFITQLPTSMQGITSSGALEVQTMGELTSLVRHQRKRLGLSQAALAVQLHRSRKWVCEFERGKALPDVKLFIQILDVLHCRWQVITTSPRT